MQAVENRHEKSRLVPGKSTGFFQIYQPHANGMEMNV